MFLKNGENVPFRSNYSLIAINCDLRAFLVTCKENKVAMMKQVKKMLRDKFHPSASHIVVPKGNYSCRFRLVRK